MVKFSLPDYSTAKLEALELTQLKNLKARFEKHGRTDRQDYPLLLQVIAKKESPLRDHNETLTVAGVRKCIEEAAANGETITYKEITDALGCTPFNKYRWPLIKMLDAIFVDCALRNEPILTAIVVSQTGITPDIAKGFSEAARRAGIDVSNPEQYFEEQQFRLFNEVGKR